MAMRKRLGPSEGEEKVTLADSRGSSLMVGVMFCIERIIWTTVRFGEKGASLLGFNSL